MKNILLIAPNYFNYYKDISKALNADGYKVFYYYDRLKQNGYNRFLKKCLKKQYDKKFSCYVSKILKETQGIAFDYIILILSFDFTCDLISRIKRANPNSKFVYYTWDSVSTYSNILEFKNLFDSAYSFDDNDCKRYGFEFLPLFYSRKMKRDISPQFDASAVMSYSLEKDRDLCKVKSLLAGDLQTKFHLYIHSRLHYLYIKFRYGKNIHIKMKELNFKSLDKIETLKLFCDSKAVIDCPICGQGGLTMRTFEVLSLNTKLITTNKNIVKYDFYTPDNICIVDENTTEIPKNFFESRFNMSYALKNHYSLNSFVQVLLGNNKYEYLINNEEYND